MLFTFYYDSAKMSAYTFNFSNNVRNSNNSAQAEISFENNLKDMTNNQSLIKMVVTFLE